MKKITISINDLKQKAADFHGVKEECISFGSDFIEIDSNGIIEVIHEDSESLYKILALDKNEFFNKIKIIDNSVEVEITGRLKNRYAKLPRRWFKISVENLKQKIAYFYGVNIEKVIFIFEDRNEKDVWKEVVVNNKVISSKKIAKILNKFNNLGIKKFRCFDSDKNDLLFINEH
ncbi:MAG: hypothetical protein PHF17_08410 [Arcobacteraceae bacterium]|nr:hypothetical protein [Arcobacteraceae bacterium]